MQPSGSGHAAIPPRSCTGCALCCHLGEIPGVKPFNRWCRHCTSHSACDIYAQRPAPCRAFFCHYLTSDVGEHWKPSDCGMVISVHPSPLRMTIAVDPARAEIWREQPYLRDILHWATQGPVVVMVGYRTYFVHPHGIDDLGELREYEQLEITEEETSRGIRRRAQRVPMPGN